MQLICRIVAKAGGRLQALEEERVDPSAHSGCAINAAVEVLGDPWAILVLRDIMFGKRRHFRDLVAARSTLTGEHLAAYVGA